MPRGEPHLKQETSHRSCYPACRDELSLRDIYSDQSQGMYDFTKEGSTGWKTRGKPVAMWIRAHVDMNGCISKIKMKILNPSMLIRFIQYKAHYDIKHRRK